MKITLKIKDLIKYFNKFMLLAIYKKFPKILIKKNRVEIIIWYLKGCNISPIV